MLTVAEDKQVQRDKFKKVVESVFGQWEKEKVNDFCELFALWHETRDEEVMDVIMEYVDPDRLGPIVFDAEVDEKAADQVAQYQRMIGKTVKRLRIERKMTQKELAELAGMQQPHLSRLEKGTHSPGALTIQRLAEALEVKPSEIDPGLEP